MMVIHFTATQTASLYSVHVSAAVSIELVLKVYGYLVTTVPFVPIHSYCQIICPAAGHREYCLVLKLSPVLSLIMIASN